MYARLSPQGHVAPHAVVLPTVIKDPSLHKFDDRPNFAHRIFEYVLDRIRM
jgi:hypothetical protein